jgi:hypothetical protein
MEKKNPVALIGNVTLNVENSTRSKRKKKEIFRWDCDGLQEEILHVANVNQS